MHTIISRYRKQLLSFLILVAIIAPQFSPIVAHAAIFPSSFWQLPVPQQLSSLTELLQRLRGSLLGQVVQGNFARGSRVQLTAATPVQMIYYGLAYDLAHFNLGIRTQPQGALGSVIGGPRTADGLVWYNVDFDELVTGNQTDGWVQASMLTTQLPDQTKPAVPAGLRASAVAYNQINIDWTRSVDNVKAGIVMHRVYRDGALIGTTASTNYQDIDRSPQTTYSYTLEAVDLAGNVSSKSAPVQATTPTKPSSHPASTILPGTWYKVPNSIFKDTQYKWDPAIFPGSQQDEVFTEGGCAYDYLHSRFLCWGGGHSAYGGNEIYQFSLETLQWARLSEPSLLIDNWGVGLNDQVYMDANGDPDYAQPRPPHVHTSLFYDPKKDQLCMTAGQGGFPDNTYYAGTPPRQPVLERRAFCYPFASKTWVRLNPVGSGQNAYGAYDTTTGLWWQRGNIQLPWSTFASWDTRTDTWTVRNPSVPAVYDYDKTADIDTKRGKFVAVGSAGIAPVITYDLKGSGTLQETKQLTSGDTDILQWGRMGFEYLPHIDRFIAWSGRGGAEAGVVYSLDPSNWVWTKIPPASTAVLPPGFLSWDKNTSRQGPETRWRYDPKYNVFAGILWISDSVYLYKLDANLPPPPAPVPTPLEPTSIAAPTITATSVTVTWTAPAQPTGTVYVILRDGVEVGRTTDEATHSYTDTTVVAGLPYYYSVKAVLGNLQSTPTTSIFVRTKTAQGGRPAIPPYVSGTQVREMFPGNNFAYTTRALNPGDTLIIHEGTYYDDIWPSITVKGTASAPVLIMGAPGEAKPVITRPKAADLQNTINVIGATYVTIKGLEIIGNGGDGIRLDATPSHITIEDNDIHDIAVGVNFRTSMDNIIVRRNHIHNLGILQSTGEGMYVGCNAATCAVTNSDFSNNWIHTSLPGTTQGDGIEVKLGSCNNRVTNNVIHDMFYPGIFVYGGCPTGQENLVEGNVIWKTLEGIYAVSDAIVRNNILMRNGNGLSLYGHSQVATIENLTVTNNTLVDNDDGMYINWPGTPAGIVLANNAVYGQGKNSAVYAVKPLPTSVLIKANYVEGPMLGGTTVAIDGTKFVSGGTAAAAFENPTANNFWLAANSPLRNKADAAYSPATDFNGTARVNPSDVGAYDTGSLASNPGWKIVQGFKGISTSQNPPVIDTTPPTIPQNLSASAISNSQISLSWSPSSDAVGVAGYRIYRGGTQIATVSGTTYQNTGLAVSTPYTYTVAAYDAAGNVSSQSTSASATTLATTPPTTFSFSLANQGNKTITETQARTQSITETVTATTVSGTPQSVAFTIPISGSINISPTSCIPNPTCTVTITLPANPTVSAGAFSIPITGTAGSVTQSSPFSVTITSGTTPTPFTLSTPTISQITQRTATVSWTSSVPASSVAYYFIFGGITPKATITETDTNPRVTTHSVAFSNLTSCGTYQYAVGSRDANNVGVYSSINTFTTGGCLGGRAPLRVALKDVLKNTKESLTLQNPSGTSLTMSVPNTALSEDSFLEIHQLDETGLAAAAPLPANVRIAGEHAYELKVLSDPGTAVTSFPTPVTVSVHYDPADIVGLNVNSLKLYRWNGSAWIAASGCIADIHARILTCTTTNFSPFILGGTSDTTAPSDVTDLRSAAITDTSAELSFTASGDDNTTGTAASYDIRVKEGSASGFTFASAASQTGEPTPQAAGGSEAYTVVGLTPNTTYTAAVTVTDAAGNESDVSNLVTFTTEATPTTPTTVSSGGGGTRSKDTTPPPPVIALTAVRNQNHTVTLSWINPTSPDFVRTRIIRKYGSAPTSRTDGAIVYDGKKQTIANLVASTTETAYFAAYTYDRVPNYALPVTVSVAAETTLRSVFNPGGSPSAVASLVLTRILSRGMEDPDVTRLQQFLITAGYLAPGNAIGFYGALTEAAVKQYQCAQQIVCTGSPAATGWGVVGMRTRAALGQGTTASNPTTASLLARLAQLQQLLAQLQQLQVEQRMQGR